MKNLLLVLALLTARGASAQTSASPASVLTDASATTAKIATDAVTSTKILNGSVTTSKLSTDIQNAITAGNIADNGVTTAKIATDAVTGVKILNGAVTTNKVDSAGTFNMAALNVSGRLGVGTTNPSAAFDVANGTFTVSGGGQVGAPSQWGAHVNTLSTTDWPSAGGAQIMYWTNATNYGSFNKGGAWVATSSGTFTTKDAGVYRCVLAFRIPALTSTVIIDISDQTNTLAYAYPNYSATIGQQVLVDTGYISLAAGKNIRAAVDFTEAGQVTIPANQFYDNYFSCQRFY